MRIALISDIHGNAVALESVLNDLKAEHIDHFVCLGDIAADGPQPCEVIAHLKALNSSAVMGNMDAWFLNPPSYSGKSRNSQRGHEIRSWDLNQLSSDDLDYLRNFQATVEISLDTTTDLLCYHGSPRSYDEGISSTKSSENLEQILAGCHATVLAGGHTHTPMVRHYGHMTIFNPGSVGAPRSVRMPLPPTDLNSRPVWAEYGIIAWQNNRLRIELRRVPVDINLMKQATFDSGMPHADWWIQNRYPGLNDGV